MSLKPIKKSRRTANPHPRLQSNGNWNFSWKPIKQSWTTFDPVKNKRGLLLVFLLCISLVPVWMYSDSNNQLFHSYTTTPTPDPTTPIQKYTATGGNLGEFNTAGNVTYNPGSCQFFSGPPLQNCMKLTQGGAWTSPQTANPPVTTQANGTSTIHNSVWGERSTALDPTGIKQHFVSMAWNAPNFTMTFNQGKSWVNQGSLLSILNSQCAQPIDPWVVYDGNGQLFSTSYLNFTTGCGSLFGNGGVPLFRQTSQNATIKIVGYAFANTLSVTLDNGTITHPCGASPGGFDSLQMFYDSTDTALFIFGNVQLRYTLTNCHLTFTVEEITGLSNPTVTFSNAFGLMYNNVANVVGQVGGVYILSSSTLALVTGTNSFGFIGGNPVQCSNSNYLAQLWTSTNGGVSWTSGCVNIVMSSGVSEPCSIVTVPAPVSKTTVECFYGSNPTFFIAGAYAYNSALGTWYPGQRPDASATNGVIPGLSTNSLCCGERGGSMSVGGTRIDYVYWSAVNGGIDGNGNGHVDVYYTFSLNGGGTWSTDYRTTTISYCQPQSCPGGGPTTGNDFFNSVSFADQVYASMSMDTSNTMFFMSGSSLPQTAQQYSALAESIQPVGDLSVAVSKELEMMLLWTPVSSAGTTLGGNDPTNDWGFFLTTNSTLYTTSNTLFDPKLDNSVALFVALRKTSTNNYAMQLFVQQKPGEAISSEDTGDCSSAGSQYICASGTVTYVGQDVGKYGGLAWLNLNYTGSSNAAQVGNTACPTNTTNGGPGCNYVELADFGGPSGLEYYVSATTKAPQFLLSGQTYYAGFWLGSGQTGSPMLFCFDTGTRCAQPNAPIAAGCSSSSMEIDYCVPNPQINQSGPSGTTDSGGFFGSVWHGLTSIGSSIAAFTQPLWGPVAGLGGSLLSDFLSALEAAGSYVINTALPALEAIVVSVLNVLGNLLGFGNVGTSLQQTINAIIAFFTSGQFGNIFTNLPSSISRLLDILTIYFPWLSTAISIGANVATFLVKGVGFALTILGYATSIGVGVSATILIVLFFVYTGDNSLGGVLEFWQTALWLIVGLGLKFLIYLVNFTLDVVTNIVGLIPKPFVQMSTHALPRLPLVNTDASFVSPSGLMGEIKNGNLFAVALWVSGLLFLDLFESASPALPGSIGALLPSAAPALVALKGLTSLLALMTVFVWIAAIFVVPIGWFANAMDLGFELPFESSLGNKPTTHFGVRFSKAEKHGDLRSSIRGLRQGFKRQGPGSNVKRYKQLGISKEKEEPIN